MEVTEKIFTGKSRADVDAQFENYLSSTHGRIAVLGMNYVGPKDGASGSWLLIFSHYVTLVDDPRIMACH